ncbi:MAG TPA: hypothetical protein VN605_15255 [Thermoanaerobaculia bacterium]|nr:hypothetical protein [Thermoanaerobaculia bacterium]
MDFLDLVRALIAGDLLSARQWVADARRTDFRGQTLARPSGLTPLELSVAAGMAELLALRWGVTAPPWTVDVGGSDQPVFLDPGLETMPRTFAHVKEEGPTPLLSRNLFATADFLDVR